MRMVLGVAAFALTASATARAQGGPASTAPLNPHNFALMAWGLSPSDPEQLVRMREAGLNISGFCQPQDLEKVNAAGLACFVTDPRANQYRWDRVLDKKTVKTNIASLELDLRDRPAAIGFFLYDEPSVKLMPALGTVARLLTHAMPRTWPYINLYPNYAMTGDLGVSGYEQYLRTYVKDVHPPFLSFDNYSLEHDVMLDRFYQNLDTIRTVSLASKTPFWNTVLAVAHFAYMEPSDATLHLQVYSSLAYGARGIAYFSYFAKEIGNYRLAPVDPFGNPTPTWDMLRRIDNEVLMLAPTLITLRSVGVYFSRPVPTGLQPLRASRFVESVNAESTRVPEQPAQFLIGEFQDREGRPYFMLVNRDLDASLRFSIQLKKRYRHLIRISPFTAKEEEFGGEMDWLAPGAGILFRVE